MRGDTIDIFPAHYEDRAWRVELFGDVVDSITEFDPLTGHKAGELDAIKVYANSHYVTPRPTLQQAMKGIKAELIAAAGDFRANGKLLEAQRLEQRTHLRPGDDRGHRLLRRHRELFALADRAQAGRAAADPVRISARQCAGVRATKAMSRVPQIGAMYKGDYRRKFTLAEYGFRLPSCIDNRPLKFEEWDAMRPQSVYVSRHARAVGDGAHRRRLRRTGDPPHRADRSAGRNPRRWKRRSTI